MTDLTYPLDDVIVERVAFKKEVADPKYIGETWQVNQKEFAIEYPGVGSFYAGEGRIVNYCADPGADPDWVKLYLNGQLLVALLHQRRILNFHGSSFIYNGRGIMILGETGAGKSSLTVSFALAGAGFLTDDLTPVIFRSPKPYIWPLYRDIKLREDTISQLGVSPQKLREAEKGTGKQYLDINRADVKNHLLHTILKIEIGSCGDPGFHEPSPAEKFSLLRSEICSWEMLAGMPETEAEYLHQLLAIVQQVKIVKVVRPVEIEVSVLHKAVREYLDGELKS